MSIGMSIQTGPGRPLIAVSSASRNISAIPNWFSIKYTFFVIGLVIVLLGILIGRRIAGRLWQMREAVESVANGRLAVSIPETNSDDEIDALGSALSVFRDNAQRKLELEKKQGELNEQISAQNEELSQTNSAIERFVPRTFLELMDKKSIVAVELGDYVERDMTILFSDIRDFTTLSEEMTPNDNFKFINKFWTVHIKPYYL